MSHPLSRLDDYALPDWLKNLRQEQLKARAPEPIPVTEELVEQITNAAESYDGNINRVRPHKAEDGLEHAKELISAFHNDTVSHSQLAQRFDLAEEPEQFSFELVLSDETVKFYWGLPNSLQQREFRQQVSGLYPNAEIKPVDQPFPDINSDMYVSGGKLELEAEKYIPIRGVDGPGAFEKDPYQSILSELVGYSDEIAIVQFVFTPAPKDWTEGLKLHEWSADQIHDSLTYGRVNGSYFNPRLDDPSNKDLQAAEAVLDQEGKQGYYANIRFLVFAPREDIAEHHAHGIASIFSTQYHNDDLGQTLLGLAYQDDAIGELARRTAAREFHYDQTVLNVDELSALAHLPSDTIDLTNIDWTRKGVGNRPPSTTPRTMRPPNMISTSQSRLVRTSACCECDQTPAASRQ